MAKELVTILTDDLDGSTAHHTIEFGIDGVEYTVDLSERNATRLRKALNAYISAGTRTGRTRRRQLRTGHPTPEQTRTIRAWATDNGYEISDRGRIPHSIVDAYRSR